MLLPAAGLIIAAAPATERRRCRGRPPAVPVLAVPILAVPILAVPPFPRPPLRVATPARLFRQTSGIPFRGARSGDHSRWKCTGGRFAGMVPATELHHSHQNHSDIPLPASKSLFRLTKSLILI